MQVGEELPLLIPEQVQVQGPLAGPETVVADPAEHRLLTGFVEPPCPLDAPQTPFTERYA